MFCLWFQFTNPASALGRYVQYDYKRYIVIADVGRY